MLSPCPTRRAKPSEEGYILVSVMFLLALLIIAMAVALPKVTADIQRDREIETYHRGLQYRRAIQLYYRSFHRYPPNVDALVKTNNIRFLRKKYIDPITGKDDWKPVLFGQNKAPLALGFFGQPLGGIGMGGNVLAGIGPPDGNGIPGASLGLNPTDPNAAAGQNAGGSPTDPNSTGAAANPNDPNSSQPFGGQSFGGAGIVGFSPASPKHSTLVYKKKDHYNEWEFTYTPLSEMGFQGNMPTLQPTGGCAPGQVCTGPSGATPTPTPTPTPSPSPTPAPQQ